MKSDDQLPGQNASTLFGEPLAGNSDLIARLRFSPHDGRIWLDENRMLLIHSSGFGVLRRELIESLGTEQARGLLTRVGYHNGAHDAELVARMRSADQDPLDAAFLGPKLHMLEGAGAVIPITTEFDEESGHFLGEYLWKDSAEAESHLKIYGLGNTPACWMQVGYASGFISRYMGKPILFRETECIAQGAKHCRIVGKPAEEWTGAEEDLHYLRADTLTAGLSASTPAHPYSLNKSRPTNPLGMEDVVGVSAGFNAVCHKLRRVADTRATVLFLGESGVGKEVFARSLHKISPRSDHPFVALNCAAIPENLVEAELFGVEKGAYTDASSSRMGRFERANHGTIFLDEIGILSLTAQGKLLRVLQERELERVGGTETIQVDVRVVAATNLDLKQEVEAGRFREDLYYRLNIFPVTVPALRDRIEDIPVFMNHFLHKYQQIHGRKVTGFTARSIDAMLNYQWPGNIRELENIVERGVIMASDNGVIDTHHLFSEGEVVESIQLSLTESGELTSASSRGVDGAPMLQHEISNILSEASRENKGALLAQIERLVIDEALKATSDNKSAAARLLGITRAQLLYRLKNDTGD